MLVAFKLSSHSSLIFANSTKGTRSIQLLFPTDSQENYWKFTMILKKSCWIRVGYTIISEFNLLNYNGRSCPIEITSFSGCKRDWSIISIVCKVFSWTLSSLISACCRKWRKLHIQLGERDTKNKFDQTRGLWQQ